MSAAQWVWISVLLLAVPFGLSMLGMGIARLKGTRLDAAQADPCYVMGRDISELLYTLFMCYWLVLFTAPLAMGCLIWAGIKAWG
ncbi:hypothetical protein [Alcanivorax sp. DP30]|uniref:hypothetical protein n=1 Tax=Alcanivorax sp. DP30 TaxID=2606217 RepID=UPI00136D600F|nr:hypothetical protein [Alcanivorax sp. DP30]MZR63132.1 hypothetical protein [Alcanivorax sp. DP30]